MSDGLPSNIVLDIFEDSRGLVWLATDAGLFEFTGEEILFRSELSRLNGERINSISEDDKGNLWLSSLGVGVCKFDGEKLSIIQLGSLSKESELTCLLKDTGREDLIIGSSYGVYRYILKSRSLERINQSAGKPVIKIRQYGNRLVANTILQENNFEFNIKSNEILNYSIEKNTDQIKLGRQEKLTSLKSILYRGKPFKLQIKNGEVLNVDVVEVEVNEKLEFYLLRYFEKGIEKHKIVKLEGTYLSDLSAEKKLDDFIVHTIFLRKGSDNLWLGTQNHGVVQIQNSNFTYLEPEQLGFENFLLQDLISDKQGDLVVASKNEIGIIRNFQIKKHFKPKDFYSLCNNKIECPKDFTIYKLGEDEKGLIWIATSKGFFTLNTKRYLLKYVGITQAEDFAITPNQELLCFWNNQFRFFKKNGLESKKPIFSFSKTAKVSVSKMLVQDSTLWIATRQKGILRYQRNEFKLFNRKNSNIHNVVNDILVLTDSTIIAGGNNGLIYKIKSKLNSLVVVDSITSLDGLVGSVIHGIQYLSDKSLWCGTNLGVHRFELNTWKKDSVLEFKFWNSKNGYFDQTGEKSVVDIDQNIWVCTKDKLLKIDTKNENEKIFNGKISLKEIQIHNADWVPDSSLVDKWTNTPYEPIRFKYNEDDLSFTFGIDFCQNVSNLRFRYFLEGFDDKWSKWSTSKKAVYSHLPSGDYILKVEGKLLSQTIIIPYSFRISLKTPWWKSWWFIVFSSLLLIGIVYLSMRFYAYMIRRNEKARTKQFNRVIVLKMRSLQNQLDPHFIFNSLNSIQSYILEEKREDALEYLSDFSNVLRKKINNANKDFISLSDEIGYLQHYLKLEQMRFSNKFISKINVSATINPYKFKLPPMLIQPFLENAIKYGLSGSEAKGDLDVSFEVEQDGYLTCTITDNGVGRTKSKSLHEDSNIKIHHKTLSITKDRIKLLNKVRNNGRVYAYTVEDLIGENGLSKGTRVKIGFPQQ